MGLSGLHVYIVIVVWSPTICCNMTIAIYIYCLSFNLQTKPYDMNAFCSTFQMVLEVFLDQELDQESGAGVVVSPLGNLYPDLRIFNTWDP